MRKSFSIAALMLCAALAGTAREASACDVCQIYISRQASGEAATGFNFGVAEQFTHSNNLFLNGEKIYDPSKQYLDSSTTQIFMGYRFFPWLGAQLNVPLIYRDYQRPRGFALEKGSVKGLGDVAFVASARPVEIIRDKLMFSIDLDGGVKFPTGDTDRLEEELLGPTGCGEPGINFERTTGKIEGFNPGQLAHAGHAPGNDCPGAPQSAISAHELSLGTGSFDGVFGIGTYFSYDRLYVNGHLQYLLHTANDIGYEFGDEFLWTIGPGFYVFQDHDGFSVALEGAFTGQNKSQDEYQGVSEFGSESTEYALAPGLRLNWKRYVSFQLAGDIPVHFEAPGLQVLPDYRIRSALTFHLPL